MKATMAEYNEYKSSYTEIYSQRPYSPTKDTPPTSHNIKESTQRSAGHAKDTLPPINIFVDRCNTNKPPPISR